MERERIVAATRAGGSDIHKRRRERGEASRGTRKGERRKRGEKKRAKTAAGEVFTVAVCC